MRTILYSEDYPSGKLFEDEQELAKARRSRKWFEAPWLVGEVKPKKPESNEKEKPEFTLMDE